MRTLIRGLYDTTAGLFFHKKHWVKEEIAFKLTLQSIPVTNVKLHMEEHEQSPGTSYTATHGPVEMRGIAMKKKPIKFTSYARPLRTKMNQC